MDNSPNGSIFQEKFMIQALEEARKAERLGEVPVGAVVVFEGEVIARGHNLKERENLATHHAEILALQEASRKLGRWRLTGCDLYVTLEPCPMCAGALIQTRADKLFFGAFDPKGGAVTSLYRLLEDNRWNHRVEFSGGHMEEACAQILKSFFAVQRKKL